MLLAMKYQQSFKLLAKEGDIAEEMMYNTYLNMGLGNGCWYG